MWPSEPIVDQCRRRSGVHRSPLGQEVEEACDPFVGRLDPRPLQQSPGAPSAAPGAEDETALPAELGGVAVIAGAEYAPMIDGRTKRHMQVGGGVAILLALMERFGVRDALTEVFA